MTAIRRIVVTMPDGGVRVPIAFKQGDPPMPDEVAAHDREGCILIKGALTELGQVHICRVCGQMYLETPE